jgi:HAD superfamily hydrolase (TIGR01490 family)
MIAAFFDVDGTLFRNSLLIEHFKKLIKYEVIDVSVWISHGRSTFQEWAVRKGDYEEYLREVSNAYREYLKGIHVSVIDFIADQVITQNWEKTYVFTRDQLRWHQALGHGVFFISGSPDFLISRMATKYDALDQVSSKYIMDDDRFTGELMPMWDHEHKSVALDLLVDKYSIDMANSYAYGDTSGDLSMFRRVGNPVAVNPNVKLFNAILEDEDLLLRTRIAVERKDMIYHVDPKTREISFERAEKTEKSHL